MLHRQSGGFGDERVTNGKHLCLRRFPYLKTVDTGAGFCQFGGAHGIGNAETDQDKIMKRKAILLAGALVVASVGASSAQTVFSVNAVGFVNKTFRANGFTLAANPLNAATNSVSLIFQGVPEGSIIFTFNPTSGGFDANTFAFGQWSQPNSTLVPGQAFFFKNSSGTAYINTFVGNVQQGTLNTPLNAGFSLVSSQVPQSGLVSTDLLFPKAEGDVIFKFNNTTVSYDAFSFVFGSWFGPGGAAGEPTIDVAEGFFAKKAVAVTWTRTFNVNQ